MSFGMRDDRNSQRLIERRTELRYDGGINASFAYHGASGGTGGVRVMPCRIASLSSSTMVVEAPIGQEPGQHLWVEVEGFGLIRCEIETIREQGFVCRHLLSDEAQKRLAVWVSWLRRRGGRTAGDQRQQIRAKPRDTRTVLILPNGDMVPARLHDISRSGAAIEGECGLAVGDAVTVGQVPSRVVRTFENGFAVSFDAVIDTGEPDRLLAGFEVAPAPAARVG